MAGHAKRQNGGDRHLAHCLAGQLSVGQVALDLPLHPRQLLLKRTHTGCGVAAGRAAGCRHPKILTDQQGMLSPAHLQSKHTAAASRAAWCIPTIAADVAHLGWEFAASELAEPGRVHAPCLRCLACPLRLMLPPAITKIREIK